MIALFGGSFDPIHHGHLLVAQAAVEALEIDELRLMPVRGQPLKRGGHAASADERADMIRLAIAGEPRMALETAELDRPGPSYTVDTLRALAAREPGQRFIVLLGADAAADLGAWREAERIPELARIVVFDRPGAPPVASPLVWRTVAVPAVAISATTIRRRVQAGQSIRYWVPDAVAEFIVAHRLYLDGRE